MTKITVINHLTLDGVMQAPGRADEDTHSGFAHGGWAAPYNDDVMARRLSTSISGGPLLLGRRTYEQFHAYWPKQTDSPYSEALNNVQKHVASTTLHEPLPWQNSTLLSGHVPSAVADLKATADEDIVVMGSGQLIRSLIPHDLIDEWLLLIYPIVLGEGKRLFSDRPLGALRLLDSVVTPKGVVIANYAVRRPTDTR
jgi:dihydrofolate reductase